MATGLGRNLLRSGLDDNLLGLAHVAHGQPISITTTGHCKQQRLPAPCTAAPPAAA